MIPIHTIDFETPWERGTYTLSKMTTEEYCRDQRFGVFGASIKTNAGRTDWVVSKDLPAYFAKLDLANSAILCQNTQFDGFILTQHYGIKPKLWLDTKAMAKYVLGPKIKTASLAELARYYGLQEKGSEVENTSGKWELTEEELARLGAYARNDVELTWDIFNKLRDHVSDEELLLIDQTIRMFTEPLLELDQFVLAHELETLKLHKERILVEVGVSRENLMSNPKFAQILEALGGYYEGDEVSKAIAVLRSPDPFEIPMKISARTGKKTFAFAKTDDDFQALAEHPNIGVQAAVSARLGVKSTIMETRLQRFLDISQRGNFPIQLNYCGADITSRDSGGGKVNPQNLPRGPLRDAILAPKGHKLIVGDSVGIELRVNLGIAGQTDALDTIRNGGDLYCKAASLFYNREITKNDKKERQFGKILRLGCQYGMGHSKFRDVAGRAGFDLSAMESEEAVNMYRMDNQMVVEHWRRLDNGLKYIASGTDYQLDIYKLFKVIKGGIVTPGGFVIKYPDLEYDDGWTYFYKNYRVNIYGSKVAENLCQCLARKVVFDQALELGQKWKVVHRVHDEIILCVKDEDVEEAKADMIRVMSKSPDYLPHVPIDCEVGVSTYYGGAK